jgi:hypothetical protein
MVTADAFHWFVYGFGNMNQLDNVFLNSWDVPFLDAVIALIAQIFYCWRIYFLRKSFVFPVLIALVSGPGENSTIQLDARNRHPLRGVLGAL